MTVVDPLYAVTTGPQRRRRLLTPVGLFFAVGLMLLVVFGGLFTDRVFALPPLLPGVAGGLIELKLVAQAYLSRPARRLQGWRRTMTLDERTKELVAVGASITANCGPCLEYHTRKASEAGATGAEIAQAADVGRLVRKGAASKLDALSAKLVDGTAAGTGEGCGCGG